MGYPFRYDYLILSSEEKPTDAANGSTAYEVNTGKFYVFYKGTWYLQDFSETPDDSEETPAENTEEAEE